MLAYRFPILISYSGLVSYILIFVSDQYLIFGAEEGIYTLNLNELHETSMEQVRLETNSWIQKVETANHVKYEAVTWCRIHPSFLLFFAALSSAVYMAICHEQLSPFHIGWALEPFQSSLSRLLHHCLYFWLFYIFEGKASQLYSHNLSGLFEQARQLQKLPVAIPTHKLPDKMIPRWAKQKCHRKEMYHSDSTPGQLKCNGLFLQEVCCVQ